METYSYYNRTYLGNKGLNKQLFEDVLCVVKERGDILTEEEWLELYDKIQNTYLLKDKEIAYGILAKHEKCPDKIINKIAFATKKQEVLSLICCRKNVSQWLADCFGTGAVPLHGFINAGKEITENKTTKTLNGAICEAVLKYSTNKNALIIACKLHKSPTDIIEALQKHNDSELLETAINNPYVIPTRTKDELFDEGVDFEAIIPQATPYMVDRMWEATTQVLFDEYVSDMSKKDVNARTNKAYRILTKMVEYGKLDVEKEALLYDMCQNPTDNRTKKHCNLLADAILNSTSNEELVNKVPPLRSCANPNIDAHRIDEEIVSLSKQMTSYGTANIYMPALTKIYEYKSTVVCDEHNQEMKEIVPAEEAALKVFNMYDWKNGHTEATGNLLYKIACNPCTSDNIRDDIIEHGKTIRAPLSSPHADAIHLSLFIKLLKEIELPAEYSKRKHLSCSDIKYILECLQDVDIKLPFYPPETLIAIAKAAHQAATKAHPRSYNTHSKLFNFESRIYAYCDKVQVDNALINLGCWIMSSRNASHNVYYPVIDFKAFLDKSEEERQKVLKETPTAVLRKIREAITYQIRGYNSQVEKLWDMVEADKMFKEIYAEIKERNQTEKDNPETSSVETEHSEEALEIEEEQNADR